MRRDGYRPLSEFVLAAWRALPTIERTGAAKEDAALLAFTCWGEMVDQLTVFVNIAALALSAGDSLRLYALQPAALRRVAEVAAKLPQTVPVASRDFFATPWALEPLGWAAGLSLTGETWSLGSYALPGDGQHFLVGMEGEGVRAEGWDPRTGTVRVGAGALDDPKQRAWAQSCARWTLALAGLVETGDLRSLERTELVGSRQILRTFLG